MSGNLSGFVGYEVYQHVVTHDFHLVTPRFNCRKYKTDYAVIAATGEVQPHGEDMRPAARIQNWWVAYPYAEVDRASGSSTASSEGAAPDMLASPRES